MYTHTYIGLHTQP